MTTAEHIISLGLLIWEVLPDGGNISRAEAMGLVKEATEMSKSVLGIGD